MAQYVWSQLTPWIKNDIRDVTHADAAAGVNDVAFIGIHIRRGDKVKHHEAKFYRAEVSPHSGAVPIAPGCWCNLLNNPV